MTDMHGAVGDARKREHYAAINASRGYDCPTCGGVGATDSETVCGACEGSGRAATNPTPGLQVEADAATQLARLREKIRELRALAEDWLSEIDWSDGRSNYGDNEAYEKCARQLTAILDAEQQDETTAQSEESEHTCCACYTHNCLPCCNPGHPLAPAPVPDDEAAKRFRDAAASLRSAQIHWPADCLMEAATMAEAHARAVRDAERALAERIAETIETLASRSFATRMMMRGIDQMRDDLTAAANIAREAVQ